MSKTKIPLTNNTIEQVMQDVPQNLVIFDSFAKSHATIPKYKKVSIGISGGSVSVVRTTDTIHS